MSRASSPPMPNSPEPLPAHIDPRTGRPNLCTESGLIAEVLIELEAAGKPGTQAFDTTKHMVFCPRAFRTYSNDDLLGQQREKTDNQEGTSLEDMGVGGIFMLHELFHIEDIKGTPDPKPWLPVKIPDTKDGYISPK